MNILLFLLAILPGLLICYLIFSMDKYEKEPKIHLFVCFVLGIFCTLPAINIEGIGANFIENHKGQLFYIFLFTTFVIGLTEEILKFFALLLYAYPRRGFNEPLDGIVYSTMIGMGFATLENLMYAQSFGMSAVLARAVTAVPAHGVFAVLMGFYVGKAKFEDNLNEKGKLMLKGLAVSLLAHGIYDFLLLQGEYQILMVFATLSVLVGVYYGRKFIHQQQAISPFRDDHHDEMTVSDLAENDRVRFIQDREIIDAMLNKMTKKEVLPDAWAEIYADHQMGDKWLRFFVPPSDFTEDLAPRMIRLPGPTPFEIVNLIFTTEYEDEIIAAAEYLRLREFYYEEPYREKLVAHLEEFDTENLSDIHREHLTTFILQTQLNDGNLGENYQEYANRAHRILCEIS
jgi:protease PrsW